VEDSTQLYILSIGVHGLVRGTDIELGRDADTGGQTAYMVDEARAIAGRPKVAQVDLATRQVHDPRVDEIYAQPIEQLAERARIVRISFGPRRYLYKERLWPHLDGMRDQLTRYTRSLRRAPDVVHGHYADAGYVGAQLAKILGVPFVFTGHSLGRVKQASLLEKGRTPDVLETRYHFRERIEAEELALETAALVIASTQQEVRGQYELYDHYQPERMEVIPPGVDLSRFSPPGASWQSTPFANELKRFLENPSKPMVLAIARPDERKNFSTLIRAFAETPRLREAANLVLVAGSRDDLSEMPAGTRRVLNEILLLIDRYDLYGSVAYPKSHESEDVPELYRLAARSGGVFVNPALTEPFGLTLLEAAASGLPVVATNEGGAKDIVAACSNGVSVDPLDAEAMGRAILDAVTAKEKWEGWAQSGLSQVHNSFSWSGHADRYLQEVTRIVAGSRPGFDLNTVRRSRLPEIDRILVSDIADTLTGDEEALKVLVARLGEAGDDVGFAIATGRSLNEALEILNDLQVPLPDVLITSSGTELHYGRDCIIMDRSWKRQIDYQWFPNRVRQAMNELPGLEPLDTKSESGFKVSYGVDRTHAPSTAAIRRHLRRRGLRVTTILDHEIVLDVLPIRASPGLAIRFLCFKWDIPSERLLVAGDSGNDADMLSGNSLGVVVGNFTPELEYLRGRPRVYFARGKHAWGILEGIEHYDFLGAIKLPDEDLV
jgi:sucrose-phosphate synthase